MHRVAIEFESRQGNCIHLAGSPGEFARQVCLVSMPGGFERGVHQDSSEFHKVLKYYVGIIFVMNIELLECWYYCVLWLNLNLPVHQVFLIYVTESSPG